ncbi:hypothetical protein P6U16_07815 [Rhizobium sp. 32-5/1]|uniref:hypothetical protein n=1 Tax=Rhizobium sp. 32-5/1 TaxID=3019602 RepID=UPI00240E2986|nr:hypothetical protein [Rhizobium sp. 32-5/1]WEZ84492.1 hypothetical protein P6U16_07815 [Rhizobium sp. 32-5/1]
MSRHLRYWTAMQQNEDPIEKSEPVLSDDDGMSPEVRRRAEERKARAAKTLRDNLMRRKQQGRARRAGAADETSGLPAAKTDESAD